MRIKSPGSLTLAVILVALAGVVWSVEGRPATVGPGLGDTPVVVRIYYNSITDLEQLAGYDLWEVNNTAEHYVWLLWTPMITKHWRMPVGNWRLMPTPQLRQGNQGWLMFLTMGIAL
ncbi:MAG: hypothetical protein R3C44_06415 [Chloroflexota bacterium]